MYILDVICNRFDSMEVLEEVLGHCILQKTSAPRTIGLSPYQWSVLEKSMQGS